MRIDRFCGHGEYVDHERCCTSEARVWLSRLLDVHVGLDLLVVCGYDGEGIDEKAFGDEVLGTESNSEDGVRAGWAALVSGEAEISSLVFWSRASPPTLLRRTDKRTNDYLCARITAS